MTLDTLRQDLRYAVRSLRRTPGVTLGIVLTLALGLGANMAMFGFLDVVFLRPPAGVDDPGQVRRVWTEIRFVGGTRFWSGFDHLQYSAIRDALGDRVATTVYRSPAEVRIALGGSETQARLSLAEATFFDLVGVRPALGRFFSAEEDRLGAGAEVAVVSHAFWRRQLGGDASALGRELRIAARRYTIVGVAEEGFTGVELDAADIWIPLATQESRGATPWWRNHNVNGFQILLRPAGDASDAVLEQRIAMGLRSPEALRRPADTANVVRLGSVIRAQGPGTQEQEVRIATRLAGVTVLVLLIACANVINLLLARAVRRRREIAVRLAMGISRARLARLLLTESVVLALLATGAALVAANWGGALLRGLLLPDIAWADSASPLHWRVVALALATGIGAGLIAGVVPAVQSIRTELTGALKAGIADGRARGSRVRSALVVVQAAFSVVLLVGAGLFISSLGNVRALRTGYDARQIVVGGVQYDVRDSVRDARHPAMLRALAEQLRGAPGVEAVALSRLAPTRGFGVATYLPDVDTTRYPRTFATYNVVSPEFFEATGMRLLRGEGFPRTGSGTMPPVVVINEAMADAQWPGMNAVGRCMRFPPDDRCYRVSGIVETALLDDLLEDPQPQYYLPIDNPPSGVGSGFWTIIVRAAPRARDGAIAELRRSLLAAFPGGRPTIDTMEQYLEPEYRPWRLGATLFTAFGLLALVVAAIGIYGTVAYGVTQRVREFGIRTALGAQRGDIVRHVVGGSVRTVAVGVLLGIALALAGGRLIASLLYGIEPGDPRVMLGVALVLLAIAALAAFGPARRAASVNPAVALRTE